MSGTDCYELVTPLVRSAADALSTMLNMSLVAGRPSTSLPHVAAGSIHVDVALTGDLTASVGFALSSDTARRFASALTGGALPISKDDLADAASELAMIITGGAKARLRGRSVAMSLSNISFGSRMRSPEPVETDQLSIHCASEIGDLTISITTPALAASAMSC